MAATPAIAREPNESELRAVIHSWHTLRQLIEKGAPVRESTPGYRIGRGAAQAISRAEKQMSIEIARESEPWREIWFITISGMDRATVYFMPDEVQGGLRRGKWLSFALLDWRVRAAFPEEKLPQLFVGEYVQIGEEPLRDFQLGDDNKPFTVSGGLSLDEVREVIELIRAPEKAGIRDFNQIQIELRDRSQPIMRIVRDGDFIHVKTGHQYGPLNGGGEFIECKKQDGKWVITGVGMWVS